MKHVGRSEFFKMESTWARKVSFYVVDLGQKSCYDYDYKLPPKIIH